MFLMPGIECPQGFMLYGWHQAHERLRGTLEGKALVLADACLKDNQPFCQMIQELSGNQKPHIKFITAGEDIKTAEYAKQVLAELNSNGHGNPSSVAVFGGGTLINFSNHLVQQLDQQSGQRLPYYVVPSTLLAVSDVALGSKGNLNTEHSKHKLRSYRDPTAIITNYELIENLPPEEIRRGLVESYKHALLQDAAYPSGCEKFWPSLDSLSLIFNPGILSSLIIKQPSPNLSMMVAFNTIFAKAAVLVQDPRETTWMAGLLSYGHLHAHAYEMASGFELNHGDSVPFGMLVDLKLGGSPRIYHLALSHLARTPMMDSLAMFNPSEGNLRAAYHRETKPFFRPDPKHPENDAFYVLPLQRIGQYRHASACVPASLLTVRFIDMANAGKAVLADLQKIKKQPWRRTLHRAAAMPIGMMA